VSSSANYNEFDKIVNTLCRVAAICSFNVPLPKTSNRKGAGEGVCLFWSKLVL